MSTNFPSSLDTTTQLENDKTNDSPRTDNLYQFQNNAADAILALEAKVGADSSAVVTSLDYLTSTAIAMRLAGAQTVTGAKTFNDATFLDKGNLVYDVAAFGGAGDDSTDNVAAITAAVAAMPAAGGVLYFGPGTWRIASSVSIAKSVHILGAGREATSIRATFTTGDVVTLTGSSTRVENIRFNATASRTSGVTLLLSGATQQVSSVNVDGQFFTGIQIAGASTHLHNVYVGSPGSSSGATGILVTSGTALAITGNTVVNMSGGHATRYALRITGCGDLQLADSHFLSAAYGLYSAPTGDGVYSIHASNCHFDGCTTRGVFLQPNTGGVMRRLQFVNCATTSTSGGSGFEIDVNGGTFTGGVEIIGHRSYGNTGDGLLLTQTSGTLPKVNVIGGTFTDSLLTNSGVDLHVGTAGIDNFHFEGMIADDITVEAGDSNNYTIAPREVTTITDGGTGTVKRVYVPATNLLGLGRSPSGYNVDVVKSSNTFTGFRATNTAAGTAARAMFELTSDASSLFANAFSSTFSGTTFGQNNAGATSVVSLGASDHLLIGTLGSASLFFGTNNTLAASIDTSQIVTFPNPPVMSSGIQVGHATDTTLTRSSAGVLAVENNILYHAGGTDVPVTDGGTGASTAAGAATNLGLGTGDSPQFTAVNVGHASDTTLARLSAGDISVGGNRVFRVGGADVPVADGGTGASDASGARTSLGLVIGTDVQAFDAELAALAGLTSAANKVPYFTGSGTAAVADFMPSPTAITTALGLGSYAANSGATWTIDDADITTFTWQLIGKRMFITCYLATTTIATATPTQLTIPIPNSKVANKLSMGWARFFDLNAGGGTGYQGKIHVNAGGTNLILTKFDDTTFATSSHGWYVQFTFDFEVQ